MHQYLPVDQYLAGQKFEVHSEILPRSLTNVFKILIVNQVFHYSNYQ